MNKTLEESLNALFKKQIMILSNLDDIQPNAKRVAFIVNKNSSRWEDVKTANLILGRAIMLEVQ